MSKFEFVCYISLGVFLGEVAYRSFRFALVVIVKYFQAIKSICPECKRPSGMHGIKCSRLKF